MRRPSRTLLAALVTAAALAVPCLAWYATGSRAARHRAEVLAARPLVEARELAGRLARRLDARLEALRLSESRRSVLDYRGVDATDGVDCGLDPEQVSPLAAGPTDPLIWAHFEIDEVGQLTLPTLPDRATHGGTLPAAPARLSRRPVADETAAIQQAILEQLECAAIDRLAAARAAADTPRASASTRPPRGSVLGVGALGWHTVTVGDTPALVALREVATPTAVLAQGFVVRLEALAGLVADEGPVVTVLPGPLPGPGEAAVALHGAPLVVRVDASADLAAARGDGEAVVTRFRRQFGMGMALALAAGLAVVGVVAQTERLARQRARFAASAAHELRTPLAGLRLYAEMLADGGGDPSRAGDYGRRIAGEAERLSRVVSNVLEFTRLERGVRGVRPSAGDLASAVAGSLERLRPALEAAGIALEVRIDGGLPAARFDPEAVHLILDNLLDNAEKYTRDADDRTVRVGLARAAGGVVLSVEDHGPGLSSAARRRVFRPYRRETPADGPAGLGLGLALVRDLAAAQGARVGCERAAGGGARFGVRFRAA